MDTVLHRNHQRDGGFPVNAQTAEEGIHEVRYPREVAGVLQKRKNGVERADHAQQGDHPPKGGQQGIGGEVIA